MQKKRRNAIAKRSATEWGVRGLLAVLIITIGFFGVTNTLANVVFKIDPARAHTLAPDDGQITASLAVQKFALKPESTVYSEPARLARYALRQDATAVEALTVLGLQAELRRDTERARRLFAHSLALSRRELQPRIWAIEKAVARGDIRAALINYDTALRTSRSAPDLLLPILSSAITEPRVRLALIKIMASKPVWGERFISYLATHTTDPEAVVDFFQKGAHIPLPVDDADRAAVVNALATQKLFYLAWDYYASFRPGADRRRSRDANFTRTPDTPALFDWKATNAGGVSASIHRSESHGVVDFSVPPSLGGVLLEQMQLMTPGAYRLEGHSIGIEQRERSLPYWTLICNDGRELGRVVMPNSAQSNGNFSGSFIVPSDCPVQTLFLVARPSDDILGVAGQIDGVQLVPVG